MTALSSIFFPRSIAIVGASDDPQRIGGRLLANMIRGGYKGPIYPVNPNRVEVQGKRAFRSVDELPEGVELAAIAVGGSAGLDHVRACCAREVPGVVVFASEIGGSASDLPELLARRSGSSPSTRIVGPNSNGVINPEVGLYASFTSMLDRGLPQRGTVAVATQSAGVGASYTLEYLRRRSLGIRFWCHVGGEADVTLDEVLSFYAADPRIRAVAVNFEVPRRPEAFSSAIASLRHAGKHVSGFHAGSSSAGQAAAATHTGVITSVRPRVLLGVAAQQGMQVAKSVREACNALEAFNYLDQPPGELALAVVTTSGGVGVLLADALDSLKPVSLPALGERLREELADMAPFASLGNPIDLTAQVINQPELMSAVLRKLESEAGLDGLIVYVPSGHLGDVVAEALARRTPTSKMAIAVGLASDTAREALHRAGVPVFDEPHDLREALAAWFAGRSAPPPTTEGEGGAKRAELARRAVDGLRQHAVPAAGDRCGAALVLDEASSKSCLAHVGVRIPRRARLEGHEDLEEAVNALGFPLVMKLLAPGVSHKDQRGFVRLGIRDLADAAEAATELLMARDAEGNGGTVIVEEMVLGTAEVFVGTRRDDEFGLLAVIARGGVDVEKPESMASIYALPVSRSDIEASLSALHLAPHGASSARAIDELTDLVDILRSLMEAGKGDGLGSIDVNPVVIERSGSCVAVDALLSFDAGERARVGSRPREAEGIT